MFSRWTREMTRMRSWPRLFGIKMGEVDAIVGQLQLSEALYQILPRLTPSVVSACLVIATAKIGERRKNAKHRAAVLTKSWQLEAETEIIWPSAARLSQCSVAAHDDETRRMLAANEAEGAVVDG